MFLNNRHADILRDTIAHLRHEPTHYPHLEVDKTENAVAVSKAHMVCRALAGRGGVYSFSTPKHHGLAIHGEYGHFVAIVEPFQTEGKSTAALHPSAHFCFDNNRVPNVDTMSADLQRLMLRAIWVGFETTSILQWFDSVYRMHTNRRVSPNFDPRQVAEKLMVMIEPGVAYLESKKLLWTSLPPITPTESKPHAVS